MECKKSFLCEHALTKCNKVKIVYGLNGNEPIAKILVNLRRWLMFKHTLLVGVMEPNRQ